MQVGLAVQDEVAEGVLAAQVRAAGQVRVAACRLRGRRKAAGHLAVHGLTGMRVLVYRRSVSAALWRGVLRWETLCCWCVRS